MLIFLLLLTQYFWMFAQQPDSQDKQAAEVAIPPPLQPLLIQRIDARNLQRLLRPLRLLFVLSQFQHAPCQARVLMRIDKLIFRARDSFEYIGEIVGWRLQLLIVAELHIIGQLP